MRLTWYGHACFRLEADGLSHRHRPVHADERGARADPQAGGRGGDELGARRGPLLLAAGPGRPARLNALDAVVRAGRGRPGGRRRGGPASEGEDRPDDPKANALYRFELGGLAFCHMGDVGTPLAEAQLAPLRGRVDVLLALAGAGLTIALPDLDDGDRGDRPKVVVPMHHRTPSLKYVVGPVEDFLARAGDRVVRHEARRLGSTRPAAGRARDPRPAGGVRPQLERRRVMAGWELGLINSVWQGSEQDGLPGHTLAREIGYDSLDLFVGFDPGATGEAPAGDRRRPRLGPAGALGDRHLPRAERLQHRGAGVRDPPGLQRRRPGGRVRHHQEPAVRPRRIRLPARLLPPDGSGPGSSTPPGGSEGTRPAGHSR